MVQGLIEQPRNNKQQIRSCASRLSSQQRLFLYLCRLRGHNYYQDLKFITGLIEATLCRDFFHVSRAVYYALQNEIGYPDDASRQQLQTQIPTLPGMIGVVDTVVLEINRPKQNHALHYVARKKIYGRVFQVVCSWRVKILHVFGGYSAGTNNDRGLFNLSSLHRRRHQFFRRDQYLIGDTGYNGDGNMLAIPNKRFFSQETGSDT